MIAASGQGEASLNEIGPQDRPDLSQPPASTQPPVPPPGTPQPQATGAQGATPPDGRLGAAIPPPPPQPASTAPTGGFDFNRSTILGMLYLASFGVIFTAIVAVVLGYVWKNEANNAEWEESHFRYHIRTFWIALIGTAVSIPLMIVLVGFLLWVLVAVLVVVRSILSMIAAQQHKPMPNPDTWLA
jgi:uncharacterized membrane protein